MEIIRGTATFQGIAIGKIRYHYKVERREGKNLFLDVPGEIQLFNVAKNQLTAALYEEWLGADAKQRDKLQADWELLNGGTFLRAIQDMIIQEKVHAGYALVVTRDEMIQAFGGIESACIKKRVKSICDVTRRFLDIFDQLIRKETLLTEPSIIMAESLSISQMLSLRHKNLLGIITKAGSDVAHSAIIAKGMNVPILADVDVDTVWDGKEAIVDGYTGMVYIEPDEEVKKEFEIRRNAELKERESLLQLRTEKDVTLDGKEVGIYANIANLDDLGSADYYGAAGIGLFRSELQYLGREEYPTEEQLFEEYRTMAEKMKDRLVVIRIVDLGADKQSAYMKISQEENPMMGNRGIRFCLDHLDVLKTQLRAIYRAGVYGELSILYPMITTIEEIKELKEIEKEIQEELKKEGILYQEDLLRGVMIETPAAVMISREIAKEVDFLSLGTNDLTQYTLAMDRQNPSLKEKYRDHHPAIFRMIEMVVEEGHKENCRVVICGELAADVSLTRYFVEMGMDALSVVPGCILPVRKVLRSIDLRGKRNGEK